MKRTKPLEFNIHDTVRKTLRSLKTHHAGLKDETLKCNGNKKSITLLSCVTMRFKESIILSFLFLDYIFTYIPTTYLSHVSNGVYLKFSIKHDLTLRQKLRLLYKKFKVFFNKKFGFVLNSMSLTLESYV